MKDPIKIMDVELPASVAADFAIKAAQDGVTSGRVIGIYAIQALKGAMHPEVMKYRSEISGPKTPEQEEEQ